MFAVVGGGGRTHLLLDLIYSTVDHATLSRGRVSAFLLAGGFVFLLAVERRFFSCFRWVKVGRGRQAVYVKNAATAQQYRAYPVLTTTAGACSLAHTHRSVFALIWYFRRLFRG